MTSTECPVAVLRRLLKTVKADDWVNEEAKKHFASGIKISIDKLKAHGYEAKPKIPPRLNPNQQSFLPSLGV